VHVCPPPPPHASCVWALSSCWGRWFPAGPGAPPELFLDRPPAYFAVVLEWMRTDRVPPLPPTLSMQTLTAEASYYALDGLVHDLAHILYRPSRYELFQLMGSRDLAHTDLSGMTVLRGRSLAGFRLDGANLAGADLTDCDLTLATVQRSPGTHACACSVCMLVSPYVLASMHMSLCVFVSMLGRLCARAFGRMSLCVFVLMLGRLCARAFGRMPVCGCVHQCSCLAVCLYQCLGDCVHAVADVIGVSLGGSS
jgi:hypothetical protein